VDGVFVDLHLVGHMRQRVELHAEFVLSGRNFVVMLFNLDAHGRHGREHFAAHVLCRVLGRDREIAALGRDAMAKIAAFILSVAICRQLNRVELEARVVRVGHELHIVKHEEFGFRADIDRIANTGRFQIGFGLLGHAARITLVRLARCRLKNIADDRECRCCEKWV